MRKMMAVAEAYNLSVSPHVYYLGPGLLASLHLLAAWPQDVLVEHAVFDLVSYPYAGAVELTDGAIRIPQEPGIGPAPDPEFLKRFGRGQPASL
jgi:L-alanine-DL-glutamate epimerase-like enolase superfamily enzyme